jgi:iron complex transport system substrate-binding protein
MDPIHVSANWVPELVEVAGGEYGLADAGSRSVEIDWGALVEYGPEVLVVAPCGVSAQAARNRIDELSGREGWSTLAAVRDGRVYAMDGSAYLNRWTPRLVDAAERLASILHPEAAGTPPEDVLRLEPPTRA